MAQTDEKNPADGITVADYLEKVARFSGNDYGRLVRDQFRDIEGASELAMLACPSAEELQQLRRAVAIMTPAEKQHAANLSDSQTQSIAEDAGCDPANLAIFLNGYALECRKQR